MTRNEAHAIATENVPNEADDAVYGILTRAVDRVWDRAEATFGPGEKADADGAWQFAVAMKNIAHMYRDIALGLEDS